MSLREQAVEAMAEVIQRSAYNTEGGDDPAFGLSWAADTLDALLLFLTEHTEEWEDEAAAAHLVGSFIADSETLELLAALRGTTEEHGN